MPLQIKSDHGSLVSKELKNKKIKNKRGERERESEDINISLTLLKN